MVRTLKYYLYSTLALLTFGKTKVKLYAKKHKYEHYKILNPFVANIKIVGRNNKYNRNNTKRSRVKLHIIGNNNEVQIGDNCKLSKLRIVVYGNDNKIFINSNVIIYGECQILLGFDLNSEILNSSVSIGNGTGIVNCKILLLENNSSCSIGKNCMISKDVNIYVSDTHALLDNISKECINYGKDVQIGDHCWIGEGTKIGKKAKIPSHSVVGWGSVVMSKFSEEHTVLAGNPAKVVKSCVDFDWRTPQQYVEYYKKNLEVGETNTI